MYRPSSVVALVMLIAVAGCGGGPDTAESGATGPVAAKAVADVDAAMADAQRTRMPQPVQN